MLCVDELVVNTDKNTNYSGTKEAFLENFVTKDDVHTVVDRSLGTDVRILSYSVKTFAEEQLGFMGAYRHLIVNVQRKDSPRVESFTYFLKSIPQDIEEQASIIAESKVFYKEANFYRYIVPQLIHEVKDKSWIGECYIAKENLLIFENLQSKSFAVKDKLLDEISLKSGLTSLAHLHASSILAEKRMGKSFIEVYPEVLKECLYTKDNKFYEWIRTSVNVIVAVAEYLGLKSDFIPSICYRILDVLSTSKTKQNVVSHGDTKSLNFMFDNSSPTPKCVLVDFQMTRYVPAMYDVSQFLYLSTRRSVREGLEPKLLKHYHEVFSEILKGSDFEVEVPTYEEILTEYEESRLVGLVSASLCSPINFIDGKECAEMAKDSDGFSKVLFQDRQDQVLKMMHRSKRYHDIIAEIVMEISERSTELLKL